MTPCRLPFVVATATLFLSPTILAQEREQPDISSQDIVDVVEDELAMFPAVDVNKIDVRCKDGVVTLSGDVDSLIERRYARRLAETVRGVERVEDRIEVKPYWGLMDWEIRNHVEDGLLQDPVTESFETDVEVAAGFVTLSGSADSYAEKQAAARVARGIRGVVGVENSIEVDPALDRPDIEISREIEQRLTWDVLVDDGLIEVDVTDGKVLLSGIVGSAAEKSRATSDAWVTGVRAVENGRLAVSAWAEDERMGKNRETLSDDAVEAAVSRNLRYDSLTDSNDIDVSVEHYVATLRGKVDSLRAKRSAEDAALDTFGVAHVDNRLKVRAPDRGLADPDTRAERDIAAAFLRDPYLERFEVDIDVIGGTAYLRGTVDGYFEKSRAETIASSIFDVTEVKNRLDVEDSSVLVYDPFLFDPYLQHRSWYDYEPKTTESSDPDIADEIEDEIWWSPFVDSEQVDVTVRAGTAILRGEVDSQSERHAATENAFEGGATWVRNLLEVKGGPEEDSGSSDSDEQ